MADCMANGVKTAVVVDDDDDVVVVAEGVFVKIAAVSSRLWQTRVGDSPLTQGFEPELEGYREQIRDIADNEK